MQCKVYGNLTEEEEHSIFGASTIFVPPRAHLEQWLDVQQRVQEGAPLTSPEKMATICTPPSALIREIVKTYWIEGPLNDPKIPMRFDGGRDLGYLASVVNQVSRWSPEAFDSDTAPHLCTIKQVDKWLV
ncbi:hypothetical protein V5O48_013187 [Marasmius crinis-equi]|uniref:Uncharacterized protein n=1 Tax=Marasmius crinis-equi TaxID=585013 RepID=A0ABR3F0S4_9AGAR